MVISKCCFISISLILYLTFVVGSEDLEYSTTLQFRVTSYLKINTPAINPVDRLRTEGEIQNSFGGYFIKYFIASNIILNSKITDFTKNSDPWKYYLQFKHYFSTRNIDCPLRFCKKRSFGDEQVYTEQLKPFGENPLSELNALTKAFYELNLEDFCNENEKYGRAYLIMMSRKIEINDEMYSVEQFCFKHHLDPKRDVNSEKDEHMRILRNLISKDDDDDDNIIIHINDLEPEMEKVVVHHSSDDLKNSHGGAHNKGGNGGNV